MLGYEAHVITAGAVAHHKISERAAPDHFCAVQSGAFLTARDLGNFTEFVQQRFEHPPFFGRNSHAAFVSEFRVAKFEGFLANLSVHGPYRQAEDAAARALGYRIGRWPLVPLTGRVVRDNGGPLEVYQTNWSFASPNGASAWLRALRGSTGGTSGSVVEPIRVRIGDESYAYRSHRLHDDGTHETAIGIDVRHGIIVLTVLVQGGQSIIAANTESLVRKALADIKLTCLSST